VVADLRLEGVSRVHPDGTRALTDITLDVADGEVLVLTGPSGSGKTTALRVVAGLEPPTSGTVAIGGEVVNDVETRDRDVALISQEQALYPFLTVEQNLRFPLQLRKVPRAEADLRVAAESRVLRLRSLMRRRPASLSAGHRQAVAVGRATIRAPQLFLMDEPLSAIDAVERVRLRTELRSFLAGLGTTTLYVTNDQTEAMVLGDRIGVLRHGRLQQVGTPAELLDSPADRFVAGFFGSPPARFVEAAVSESGGIGWYVLGGQRLRIPAGIPGPLREYAGRRVVLAVRTHQLSDVRATPDALSDARLIGVVERVERLGHADLVYLRVGGELVGARFAPRTAPARGATVEVVVDVAELQAFDPLTERAIWHGRGAL
jgi:multiple sugar transport system ATP-binding protein